MTNRITELFRQKNKDILSIYFTAGYPSLEDTLPLCRALEAAGADMLEIGMPFSDPIADGPVIQESSKVSLENGMTLKLLFSQLEGLREEVSLPVLLMGYLNPVMRFGEERFFEKCAQVGVDGLILPDLPLDDYLSQYQSYFKTNNLSNVFLITPETSDERVAQLDKASRGFLYMVSSSSTTGGRLAADGEYFSRIEQMNLSNPRLIGFGIRDRESFAEACRHARGAIIGSAFIRSLSGEQSLEQKVKEFVGSIR